jgi:heat shock protein HslJ
VGAARPIRRASAAAVLLLGLGLAGCAGSGTQASASASSPLSAPAPAPAPASASASAPATASAPAPAAAPAPARPLALAFASTLSCGDRTATVGSRGNTWVLAIEGRELTLRTVPAPVGVRYEAVDEPGTSVANVGDRARVIVRGEAWPDCRTGPVASGAPPGPPSFAARGHEPAWRLDLDGAHIRFVPGIDGAAIEAPTPTARPAGAGRRWAASAQGRPLTVTATERVCTDSMTGMPHPLEVAVGRDGRDWFGCGGEPAMLLGGAEWVVEDIDGAGIIDRSRATLVFLPDGRIVGRASCNEYAGRWTLDAERLSVGSLASTTKACVPALMLQERRFLDRLKAVSRFEITPEGALRLRGDRPGSLLARR